MPGKECEMSALRKGREGAVKRKLFQEEDMKPVYGATSSKIEVKPSAESGQVRGHVQI
jgi:hypothetical protein